MNSDDIIIDIPNTITATTDNSPHIIMWIRLSKNFNNSPPTLFDEKLLFFQYLFLIYLYVLL